MTVAQTVLVFVGAPAVVVAVLTLFVLGPAAAKAPRYRPGRGWAFDPVWYLPHPQATSTQSPGTKAITAGATQATRTARGGASGSW